jgi:hypothetical protein
MMRAYPKAVYTQPILATRNLDRIVQRRADKSYTLTRPQSSTAFFTPEGKRLPLKSVLPQRVGQTKEMPVLVGVKQRHPLRLLMMRVPPEVAEQRRARLFSEAARLQKPVSDQALELTRWLLLLTDAPAKRLSLQEAIVAARANAGKLNCFSNFRSNMDKLMNGAQSTAGGSCANCMLNSSVFCSNIGSLFSLPGTMNSAVWSNSPKSSVMALFR